MSFIEFRFLEIESPIKIQINENDLFKGAMEKFAQKARIDPNKVIFLCGGEIINENTLNKQLLKNKNNAIVIVQSIEEDDNQVVYVDSLEVICPECKEPCIFQIDNFRIKLSNCKNGHIVNNVKLKEFKNKQKINYTNIICDICKNNNKGNAQEHKFNYCITCKKNLCLLCGYTHDKSHKLINHDKKNYTCLKHNELFSKYCNDCNQNICIACEDEHGYHKLESFSNIMPDIEQTKKNQKDLKDSINLLDNIIKQISDEIKGNLEELYKINDNIIKTYESQNKNYQIFKNVNEINLYNKIIIDEINNISNNRKLENIIQIYNAINGINNSENISKNDEQKENKYLIPISKDHTINIYNNMIKYVCGIKIDDSKDPKNKDEIFEVQSTGFFAKIPYNSKMLHVLITDCYAFEELDFSEIKE